MRSPLIAVVLCIVVNAAAAQCVAPVAATPAAAANGVIKASAPAAAGAPAAATVRAGGGELIKAAAAGTRDDVPGARGGNVVTRTQGHLADDSQDHPRRGGTAMLLAALALMSAIALRRFGSAQ